MAVLSTDTLISAIRKSVGSREQTPSIVAVLSIHLD